MSVDRRAVLALGLLLSACSGDAPAPRTSRTLRIAIGGRPALDPHQARHSHDILVAGALFKGLVGVDAAGGLTPALARSWNVSEDGQTYTFRLREAQWSDGRPIIAEDFVASFARAFNKRTGNRLATALFAVDTAIAGLSGRRPGAPFTATALTDEVLQISLSQPLPALLGLLAHPAMALVPLHAIRRFGKAWTLPDNLVVSGPFKPTAWGPQNRIELVPNPQYWDAESLALDRIFLVPAVDDDATFAGFRDGVLDIVTGDAFPLQSFGVLRANAPQALRLEQGWNIFAFIVNDRRAPFDQPQVRRALSMAIDRQLLIETLQLGTGVVPTAAMVPATLPSYGAAAQPDWWTWPPEQRLAEARRLLTEAGFSPEQPLDITVSQTPGELARRTVEAVAQQWGRLGVRVRAAVLADDALEAALASGNFEVASQMMPSSVDMPELFLARTLCNAKALNPSGYCNAEADRALVQALALADVAARTEALKRAELLVVAETPFISLFTDINRALVRPGVEGWTDNATGRHPLELLSVGGKPR